MENKIMLEWNVDYHFRFNPFYPTNLKLIFTVPISSRVVYISLNIENNFDKFIVLLDTQKFIHAWSVSADDDRFKGYNTGTPDIWRKDYKFHHAETGFNQGIGNPVPIADSIRATGRYPNCNIYFEDNVTRTIWLLANQAQYFPIAVGSIDEAHAFQKIAGRENCAVYPCEGIYHAWLQQSGHLLPTLPE